MRKPNIPQLQLLITAHRNGGRLPSQSFAYYGVYAPYGGTEKIQAALAEAADTRDDIAAEKILRDRLDRGQMLMAGGFLGVDRRDTDAPGTLAERYVTAIRAGRIPFTVKSDGVTPQYVRPSTLRACIRAGWLTEKWQITKAGYTAGRAVSHHDFGALDADNEKAAEAPAPADHASRVAAGMGGYNAGRLTAEARAAAKRGVAPAQFLRLLPKVAGELVDELLPRIAVIRTELERLLIEGGQHNVALTIAGDPRETGYRVALVEVRQKTTLPESVRKVAFLLEMALSACRAGNRDTADRCLTRAAGHLTQH